MDDLTWLRLERDRRAIEEMHKLYFSLINQGRADELDDKIWAPDAVVIIGSKVDPKTGELVGGYQARGPGAAPGASFAGGLSAIKVPSSPIATTHAMQQCVIELDGDAAISETYVNSYLVIDGEPRRILVRAIRYLDRLVKLNGEWRIKERRPSHDWMFEAEATASLTFAERLQTKHLTGAK